MLFLLQFIDLFDTVIVYKAHHFPAKTCENIIGYFSRQGSQKIKKIFLTSTTLRRSSNGCDQAEPILGARQQELIAYELKGFEAITQGIIREICFEECGTNVNDSKSEIYSSVIEKIAKILIEHDLQNNKYAHQAIILVLNKHEADDFEQAYNIHPLKIGKCIDHFILAHVRIIFKYLKSKMLA